MGDKQQEIAGEEENRQAEEVDDEVQETIQGQKKSEVDRSKMAARLVCNSVVLLYICLHFGLICERMTCTRYAKTSYGLCNVASPNGEGNFSQTDVSRIEQFCINNLKCRGDYLLVRSAYESNSKDKLLIRILSGRVMPLFQTGLAFSYYRGRKTWSFKRIVYYVNTTATFQILLKSGDAEVNPGPEAITNGAVSAATQNRRRVSPKCTECKKTVAKNQKHYVCTTCFDFTHAKCANISTIKFMSGVTPKEWICPNCTISVLPFYMHELPCLSDNDSLHQRDYDDNNTTDVHLQALEIKATQLKIMHINTQSMVSTFDGLLTTLSQYPFDIITMSETWLKDNELLLQHVTIPGYCHTFQNRDRMRGGVLACI